MRFNLRFIAFAIFNQLIVFVLSVVWILMKNVFNQNDNDTSLEGGWGKGRTVLLGHDLSFNAE